MVLHRRAVVVENGKGVARSDQIVIVDALVLVVMDDGREVAGEEGGVVAEALVHELPAAEDYVQALEDVGGVDAVVVGVVGVPIFDEEEEADELGLVEVEDVDQLQK